MDASTSYSLAVPNNPALIGQVLYAQGVQLEINAAANTKYAEILFGAH